MESFVSLNLTNNIILILLQILQINSYYSGVFRLKVYENNHNRRF